MVFIIEPESLVTGACTNRRDRKTSYTGVPSEELTLFGEGPLRSWSLVGHRPVCASGPWNKPGSHGVRCATLSKKSLWFNCSFAIGPRRINQCTNAALVIQHQFEYGAVVQGDTPRKKKGLRHHRRCHCQHNHHHHGWQWHWHGEKTHEAQFWPTTPRDVRVL